MGQAKSKTLKFPQYPQPPGYSPYYPYPVHPQVGFSQGYHLPVLPPGYGPPVPQPQTVPWPPQPRHRKKKKKTSGAPGPAQIPVQQPVPAPSAPPPPNVQPAPAGMLDDLPPGFVPQSITPNPPGAPGPVFPPEVVNSTAQGAVPPPLFTPGVPGNAQLTDLPPSEPILRRAATPFVAARPARQDSDEEDDDSEEQDSHSHRRATSDPLLLPPITADDPIASPHVPPNPLPPPPRDLYELSPYKQLVHLPNTMALLTARTANLTTVYPNSNAILTRSATNPGMAGVGAGINAVLPRIGKKKKGFFSFRRGATAQSNLPSQTQHQLGNIQFVPIYQNAPGAIQSGITPSSAPTTVQKQAGPNTDDGASRSQAENPVPPVPTPPSPPLQRSPPPPGDGSDDDGTAPPDLHRSTSPVPHQSHHASVPQLQQQQQSFRPPPPTPLQPPQSPQRSSSQPYLVSPNGNTIEFSHASLPEFLNHSPHRVMYRNKIYPSAMHLHEAMKFLETQPELAEAIRTTENVEDVYPFTARLQVWVRPDWGSVFLEKMAEVLWHKFTQHHHLRTMLLKTGNARIVYSDHVDPYWGSGANFGAGSTFPGTNYLGKLLENVRERLRESGY